MLRRIEAEERLAAITDGTLAAGNLEQLDARRHQRRLQEAARGGERPPAAKADPAALAEMGLGVIAEPADGALSRDAFLGMEPGDA